MKKIVGFVGLAILVVVVIAIASSSGDEGAPLPPLDYNELVEPTHGQEPAPVVEGQVPEGMYLVGTDIPAGLYRTTGAAESVIPNCYWERLRDASGEFDAIIANGNPAGPASVQVKAGEYFSTTGCEPWTLS